MERLEMNKFKIEGLTASQVAAFMLKCRMFEVKMKHYRNGKFYTVVVFTSKEKFAKLGN
jgi:hypothetical protein